MADEEIDDVDRAILYALQEDARNMSSGDIAERTDTSDSTVRKRINHLESSEVIKATALTSTISRRAIRSGCCFTALRRFPSEAI